MRKSKLISIAALAAVFGVVAYLGFSGVIEAFESWLPTAINPKGEIGEWFYAFTMLGDTEIDVLILTALVLLPLTCKRVGIPVATTAIVSTLLNRTIKNIIARPRPLEKLLEAGGFSFPSGHSMNNMALYLMLAFCIMPYCKHRWQKVLTLAVLLIFPIMMGISRIYFNVHYFSDVICGWCLGAIIAICFSEIFKKVIKDA
ncbi:MAG: phosphatase PAP2 family protein [Clostridia bacterium]|nr:phosphatase PAP2 family protein [Clostridia bacterium]